MKYSELPKEIKLQDDVNTLLEVNEELRKRINKALEYINYMFDKANENDIIDDLLKIEKILKGSEDNE